MSHAVVKADKDELIPCPYDPVHMISQMRFPYHLIKCRKNHNGREYQQCPFDARHVILRSEYAKHVEGCDKRAIIEPQLVLDDTHTIEIPESKAHEIQAALSNEWDIPVHSAEAANSFSGGQHEVNSFRHFDTRSDHGSSNSFAGASNGNSFSSFKAPVGASAQNNNSYNSYQSHKEAAAQPSYNGYHDNNQSPSGARAQPSPTPNFAPQPTVTVPPPAIPRKPRASSKKGCSSSDSCGSSEYSCDLQKPSSVGRGRAAVGGAVTQIPVEGNKMGPHSYEIKPTFPGHAECYNSPPSPPPSSSAIGRGCDGGKAPAPGPPSSFGRGRANPRFDDEIPVRRPGFTERQSLEKDKQKYLKKIRECKALEDRLHAGEVLEENQVAKVALQASYMNELNKISKKLEKMDLCS